MHVMVKVGRVAPWAAELTAAMPERRR